MYSKKEIMKIKKGIEPYKNFYLKNNSLPFFHLTTTLILLIILIISLKYTKLTILLTSLFLIRTFMIFHDCGHKSFFKLSKEQFDSGEFGLNKHIGNLIGTFMNYSWQNWSEGHGQHHKNQGNKNKKDPNVIVLDKTVYQGLPKIKKIIYRIIRSPPIFFCISPLYLFYLQHLFEIHKYTKARLLSFVRIAILYTILYKVGGKRLMKRYLLSQYIASILGMMLFHLQHHVNTGYWEFFDENDTYKKDLSSLHGSSFLQIPWWLKWVTNGIEYHDIHHFSPRIPCYNLSKCYNNNKHLLKKSTKINMKQAFKSLFHTLYDKKTKRYISFPLAKRLGLEA